MKYLPKPKYVILTSLITGIVGILVWWILTDANLDKLFEFSIYTGVVTACIGMLIASGASEGLYSEHNYSIEWEYRRLSEMEK